MQVSGWSQTAPWIRRFAVALAIALGAAMVAVPLYLRAPPVKPACPVAKIYPVQDRDGTWYFILRYEDGVEVVRQRMEGLRDGTCAPGDIWAKDARFE